MVEEKRTNKHGLWLACILRFMANVYSSKTHTRSPGMLTHLLTLANLASETTHSSSRYSLRLTALFCRLVSSLLWSLLSTSVNSRTFLRSSSSCLVGNLARQPFVWVLRRNWQRNLLTGTYPHPHNECPTSCHNNIIYYRLWSCCNYCYFYSNYSVQYFSFFFTKLNDSTYYNISLKLNLGRLFAHCQMVSIIPHL